MRYAAVIFLVLALAACGGSAGGVSGGGASIAPSTADAFIALDTHVSASEWPAVSALLERFPVQDPVLAKLRTLDLGGEVDLVDVHGAFVVLTRSSKAQIVGFVSKKFGGWTALAHDASAFAPLGGDATLAKSRTYQRAMETLPSGALARAFAGPSAAQQFLASLPGREAIVSVPFGRRRIIRGKPGQPIAPETAVWATAVLVGGSHSVTLEAHARVLPPSLDVQGISSYMEVPVPPYTARLVDEIPADALAVADFQVLPGEFALTDPKTLPPALQTLVTASPPLLSELDSILGGETAIYARAGGEVTLVTQPNDTNAAIEQLAGVAPILKGIKLHTTVFGGELVISTSQQGLAAFRAGGAKLSSSKTFQKSGLPAQTTGFVYANLESGSAGFAAIAPLLGLPVPNGPERALVSYGTRAGVNAGSVLVLQTR